MSSCPAPVEPRPDPSSTLSFLRAGLYLSTMSRFELKPPVATMTALLLTATLSPVLVLRPCRPVTQPPSRLSPVISVSGTISPPRFRKPAMSSVIRPRPLRSGRVQRCTELPSWNFHVDPLHAEAFGPVIEIVEAVLDVVAGPDQVGRRTSPLDPVLEGQVGRVVDAVVRLQWGADDPAAASGDDGCTTELGVLLEGDGARSCITGLDAGCHTGAACTNDRDVGLVLLATCH